MSRFEVHTHSEYSNLRLLDCINKPKNLINRAIENGLSGLALTDHECLSASIQLNKIQKEITETNPEFKIAIGNEIYLTDTRDKGQKYYHFILIAKNKAGFKQLRQLSSRAWMQSYFDRGLERVPTLKSEIEEIILANPGNVIATTACIGGELSSSVLRMEKARLVGDNQEAVSAYNQIVNFITWCQKVFGEDFYIECAPGMSKDQIIVNKKLVEIAHVYNIKMVIGTDAHYLKKEDRYVHKAYLNSKGGEREVDDFYEYSYLQTEEEIKKHLELSIVDMYDEMCNNSMEIYNKIELYDLSGAQRVPAVPIQEYPKKVVNLENYPTLSYLYNSDDIYDRYWINECENQLKLKGLDKEEYWQELEYEADIKKAVGDKLGTNVFKYPITLKYYIDLMWDSGSLIGAGRGSSMAGLNHYLLGVTQIDPVKTKLNFFWRYMNKDRVELPDIDIDLCPSKRPLILSKIKKERGQRFKSNIDSLSRANLGCTLVATFGTETAKSTILTACRGYRSETCTEGIDTDTAQYLSSLVPAERGALWTLDEVVYGNKEKGRLPVKLFTQEVQKYPGLLDIMFGIQGLINKRSSHASGVIFFDEDPYEVGCFMRTPKGEIITQWDLHDCEWASMVKYDFLVTEIEDKLCQTIKFLQEDGQIEKELSLREVYDKYFHPDVLPLEDEATWESIRKGNILNLFQFDSLSGSQGIAKVQPKNIQELSDTNGLIRLMAGEGEELPMDKYVRFKKDIKLWYKEMERYGLTQEQQKNVSPYFKPYYGVPISQEVLMRMVMDEHICGFSLKEANELRKVLAKKQVQKIPLMKDKIIRSAETEELGKYIWNCGAGPQMSYSFSILHATAYSYIGYQTAYIATKWNPIYWNTACLVVNSGSLEETEIEFLEDEDGDIIGSEKKESTTDYTKLAIALGEIIEQGIKVSLVDINKSSYGFIPDVVNNQILFGMKALSNINTATIEDIIKGRPYKGIKDFINRCPLKKPAMISLIKAGAFDELEKEWAAELDVEPRILVMTYYLSKASEPKKRLTLQNFNGLLERGMIPEELNAQKDIFIVNKWLKNYKWKEYYKLDWEKLYEFFCHYFDEEMLDIIDGVPCIKQKTWEKLYKQSMEKARDYLKTHQEEMLAEYNYLLFKETWDKYAEGNISAWEMDSLCFYYHDHELKNVDNSKYGISNFYGLPAIPIVKQTFKRNNQYLPIFDLTRIAGTVISKNDTRHTVSLLTTNGVVTVKFTKDYYALFGRQISEIGADKKKHILERGWFVRGTKLLVMGFRRENMFVCKKYKSSGEVHQLYKITAVKGPDMVLVHDRAGQN